MAGVSMVSTGAAKKGAPGPLGEHHMVTHVGDRQVNGTHGKFAQLAGK